MNDLYETDEWMAQHDEELVKKYAGKWVAVTPKGVAASADSFKALVKQKAVKIGKMLITRIPTLEQLETPWILSTF